MVPRDGARYKHIGSATNALRKRQLIGAELIARLVRLDVRIAAAGRIQQGLLEAQAAPGHC
jgi:hypothetical protein